MLAALVHRFVFIYMHIYTYNQCDPFKGYYPKKTLEIQIRQSEVWFFRATFRV